MNIFPCKKGLMATNKVNVVRGKCCTLSNEALSKQDQLEEQHLNISH